MKLHLESISTTLLVLSCINLVNGRGGGGGGGRGGGGGYRGGSFGRTGGRGLSRSQRVGAGAAVVLGSGAAGYAAYRAHQNSKNRDRERDRDGVLTHGDIDSFEQYYSEQDGKWDYKLQESTSYYASEGIGMSAWALIFLILAVIAIGTCCWYCFNVFVPVYQDDQHIRRRSMLGGRLKDEVPLQETPSTATPSP